MVDVDALETRVTIKSEHSKNVQAFKKSLYSQDQATGDLQRTASQRVNLRLKEYFESNLWDVMMTLVVSFNIVLLIIESDSDASGSKVPQWVTTMNNALLIGFSLEMLVKLLVYRCEFFFNPWHVSDLTIVSLDVTSTLLSMIWDDAPTSLSMLRILRVIRIGKAIDFMMMFPELGMMLTSLSGTLKSIFWGCLLLVLGLLLFGILAVQIIHPINKRVTDKGVYVGCDRCPRAFSSVWESILTLFQQLIAGDSWGTVSLPIIHEESWTFLYFAFAFVGLELLVTNVILAAVVEAAQSAKDSNVTLLEKQKEEDLRTSQRSFVKLCKTLDTDGNQRLTKDELINGFETNKEFSRIMRAMEIHPEDMATIWGILDCDKSGDVDFEEFAGQLFKFKACDMRTMLIFVKHHVQELHENVQNDMKALQDALEESERTFADRILAALSQSRVRHSLAAEEKAKECDSPHRHSRKDTNDLSEIIREFKADLQASLRQIESKMDLTRSFANPLPERYSSADGVASSTQQSLSLSRSGPMSLCMTAEKATSHRVMPDAASQMLSWLPPQPSEGRPVMEPGSSPASNVLRR